MKACNLSMAVKLQACLVRTVAQHWETPTAVQRWRKEGGKGGGFKYLLTDKKASVWVVISPSRKT